MFEILKFTPIQKDTFQSIVDIKIPKWGNFIIKGVKVFEKEGGRWIGFPQKEIDLHGERKYVSIICFEKSTTMDLFQKRFFEAYDKFIEDLSNAKTS